MKENGRPVNELNSAAEQRSGFREFIRHCTDCGNDFTVSVPDQWFTVSGEIASRHLPDGVNAEVVSKIINKNICGGCENNEKLNQIDNGPDQSKD